MYTDVSYFSSQAALIKC